MTKQNIIKLRDAGYRFIRSDMATRSIKEMTFTGNAFGWKILEKGFISEVMRDKRYAELLQDPKILEA